MGLRSTAVMLLLAGAGGALAACGHYGPPVRAEEYLEKQEAERAEQQLRRQQQRDAAGAPAQGEQKQGSPQDAPAGGTPAPAPDPLQGEVP